MIAIAITVCTAVVAMFGIWLTKEILSLRRIVPTNQVHIVQRADKATSYGVGKPGGNKYYQFPSWVPYIGVTVVTYPVSVFDIDLMGYEAYDKDRLPFVVDVKAFFRINNSDTAASRVSSFSELQKQLLDIVRGAVRSLLAKSKLENIMEERSVYGEMFTKEIVSQLEVWGVTPVKNIELMDIRDSRESRVIDNIMAKEKSRIEMESRTKVAANRKLADQAEIEAAREVALIKEQANEQVGKRKADVTRTVGIANEQAEQSIKEQAKVTAEKDMAVQKVQKVEAAKIAKEAATITAEQNKVVAEVNAEANKKVATVTAEAQKSVEITKAEGVKQSIELQADANLTASLKQAEGIEAQGKATAVALKEKELARINPEKELIEAIGNNKEYQTYLINLESVKAQQAIGIEQARNLGKAEIKIFSTGATVDDGVKSAMGTFSPKLGLGIASAIEAFKATPAGKEAATSLGTIFNKDENKK